MGKLMDSTLRAYLNRSNERKGIAVLESSTQTLLATDGLETHFDFIPVQVSRKLKRPVGRTQTLARPVAAGQSFFRDDPTLARTKQ